MIDRAKKPLPEALVSSINLYELRDVSTELHQVGDSPRRNFMESVAIELHTLGDFSRDACRFHALLYEQCLPTFAVKLLLPGDLVPDPTSFFGLRYHVLRRNLNQTVRLLEVLFHLLAGWTRLRKILEPYDLKAHSP